jgi:eukaryotic-like serine/threonine-protein kinase
MRRLPDERDEAQESTDGSNSGFVVRADPEAPTLAGEVSSDGVVSSGPHRLGEGELRPGELLDGHYRVERRIGGGGMGSVYEVEHVALGKRFAAKVVLSVREEDEGAVMRLRNEARTLSSLDHENIVGVSHLGRTGHGRLFVVMDLLQGDDLGARIRRQKDAAARGEADPWLPDNEVRRIVPQVLSALSAAHHADVVHRDLKPENLFLDRRRSRTVVKVVDFGISKIRREDEDLTLTRPGQILGTPLYMAPEQARSIAQVDGRADLYSLGCILYEMLTGRPPFLAENAYDCVVLHATEKPEPPGVHRPGLPTAVEAFILRALEKDPADRFTDADAMLAAWEAAWTEAGYGAVRTSTSISGSDLPPAPTPPRSWRRSALMALSAVLVAAAAAWWVTSGPREVAPALVFPDSLPVAAPASQPEPVDAPAPVVEVVPEAQAPAVLQKRLLSSPSGAEVWVDGQKRGETPLSLEVPSDGKLSVRLTRRGFNAEEREVSAGDPEEITVRLQKARRVMLPLAPR